MEQHFYPVAAAVGSRAREDLEAAEALLEGWQAEVTRQYPDLLRHLVWDAEATRRLQAAVQAVVEAALNQDATMGYRRHLLPLYVRSLMNRLTGLGPLDALLVDDSVSEIMVNGPQSVYVERAGVLEAVASPFTDSEEVTLLAQRLAARAGRTLNTEQPLCDAPLADGSRIHCALPPVAATPLITIRRFRVQPLTAEQLLADGSLDEKGLKLLTEAVQSRANVVVAGGASSGKTSLLRLLAAAVPADERVVTIEDVPELNLARWHPHAVSLEASPRHPLQALVAQALRMRPDRLVVGEVRGAESFDLLEAMASGHAGLSSVHSADDGWATVYRLARLALRAAPAVGLEQMVEQVLHTVDWVVHMRRTPAGRRLMSRVCRVAGGKVETVWERSQH